MANETSAPEPGWHRVAEQVAEELREQILNGDLPDGAVLPKEEVLRATFPVSKPSMREALRILETEGLLSVRRGNVGGAVVSWPTAANVAYSAALVLQATRSTLEAVQEALRACVPSCYVLCAERPDRMEAVVPRLRRVQQQALDHVSDLAASSDLARQFQVAVIDLCGNDPLRVVVRALEQIWTSHRVAWAGQVPDSEALPVRARLQDLMLHEQLIDLIAAGEAEQVRRLSADHMAVRRHYLEIEPPDGEGRIDSKIVRARLSGGAGPLS